MKLSIASALTLSALAATSAHAAPSQGLRGLQATPSTTCGGTPGMHRFKVEVNLSDNPGADLSANFVAVNACLDLHCF